MSIKLKRLFLTLTPMLIPLCSMAQDNYVDSVRAVIENATDDSVRAESYIDLVDHYYNLDLRLAASYLDSAEIYADTIMYPLQGAWILFFESIVLSRNGEYDAALNLSLQAEDIFDREGDMSMSLRCLYSRGQFFLIQGKYLEAYEVFFKYHNVTESRGDTLARAAGLNGMGVVQRRMGNLEKAMEHYQEYYKFVKESGTIDMQATGLMNMGIVEKNLKNYDQAIALYKQAEDLGVEKDPGNKSLLGYVYGNFSSLYKEMGKYEEALFYSKKTLEIRKDLASEEELANTYIGLAINSIILSQLSDGKEYLDLALKSAGDNSTMLRDIHRTYADYYRKIDNAEQVFQSYKKAWMYQDSINNKSRTKQIDELATQYDLGKKDAEIENLAVVNELSEARIASRNLLILFLLGGILLALVFFYTLYKKNKRIDKQNEIISSSLEEKDLLLKEIHHRVKNNLQVISALLDLQSKHLKDDVARGALRMGQDRVEAMALIHKNLYQYDHLKGVGTSDYFRYLTEHLVESYSVQQKIGLDLAIDDLLLDVDTMVPLGLVANELISNCLKHAFTGREEGNITIRLTEIGDQLSLTIIDDGIGDHSVKRGKSSFGQSLVKALALKLDAELSIHTDKGYRVDMRINNYRKSA